MSERNGDRARFQKDRARKMRRRQRVLALVAAMRKKVDERASSTASLAMQAEGGPPLNGE